MERINTLMEARQSSGVLIAAHRGVSGGNIPCNSIAAFEVALQQGTDILEVDVTACRDGELFVFHPRQERNHLNLDIHLEQMSAQEIRKLRFVNMNNAPTLHGIATLDEFLETFKNRCLINLDHGWDDMPQMIDAVRRHGMEEQILIKTPSELKYAQEMEALAPDIMYMPIFKEEDTLTERLEGMDLNFVAVEVVFAQDDSPLAQEAYLKAHQEKGRLTWCNALLYNCKKQLSGGHTDDISVTGDPDSGWGWILDRGFDVIQTDWVMQLRRYLENRK